MAPWPSHTLVEGGVRRILLRGSPQTSEAGDRIVQLPQGIIGRVNAQEFCVRASVSRTWIVDERTTGARLVTCSEEFRPPEWFKSEGRGIFPSGEKIPLVCNPHSGI